MGFLSNHEDDDVSDVSESEVAFFKLHLTRLLTTHDFSNVGQCSWSLTWDQALFSFRFITFLRARQNKKRAWYKPSVKRLLLFFLIDWHLPNQPTKIISVACFSSMQIFHAREKCRLADLKNSFYLLKFSSKNKTVSTITFNFLRD